MFSSLFFGEKIVKKLFKNIFYLVKELAGENHYQRYLKDAQSKHAPDKLMTQKEFYLHQIEKNGIRLIVVARFNQINTDKHHWNTEYLPKTEEIHK